MRVGLEAGGAAGKAPGAAALSLPQALPAERRSGTARSPLWGRGAPFGALPVLMASQGELSTSVHLGLTEPAYGALENYLLFKHLIKLFKQLI